MTRRRDRPRLVDRNGAVDHMTTVSRGGRAAVQDFSKPLEVLGLVLCLDCLQWRLRRDLVLGDFTAIVPRAWTKPQQLTLPFSRPTENPSHDVTGFREPTAAVGRCAVVTKGNRR